MSNIRCENGHHLWGVKLTRKLNSYLTERADYEAKFGDKKKLKVIR